MITVGVVVWRLGIPVDGDGVGIGDDVGAAVNSQGACIDALD
jgi:hypothetical protein